MKSVNEIFNRIPNGMPFPIVMDGATRTRLIELGMSPDCCMEQWIMESPAVYQEMERNYVRSGANMITAPTAGSNRNMLNKYNLGASTPDITRKLVGVAIGVGMSWHCGSMAPTGKTFEPGADTAKIYDEIFKIYSEQAAEMDKVTVNFFLVESMTSLLEAKAAVAAINDVANHPIIFVSFKVDKSGKTESGDELLPAMLALSDMGVNAFGCNCNLGPDDMLEVLKPLAPYAVKFGMPLIAQPNAEADGKTYSEDDFCDFAKKCINEGILVIGGGDGTNDSHIRGIRKAMDEVKFENEELLNNLPDTDMIACTNNKTAVVDLANPEIIGVDEKLFEISGKDFAIVEVKSTDEADFILNNSYKITVPMAVKGNIKAVKYLKKYYNGRIIDVSRALRG